MQPDSSFADLMARLRQGDQEAAHRIYEAFTRRLIALARTRLDGSLRQKEDPEDIVQSALASFFRRQSSDPYELTSWESLWGLLATITLRKCGHHVEYYLAQCRDIRRETTLPETAKEDSVTPWQALAREPTPSEAAVLRDTLERLLHDLHERERTIVLLALEGFSVAEISRQVGRSESFVRRRVLDRVRERWRRLSEGK